MANEIPIAEEMHAAAQRVITLFHERCDIRLTLDLEGVRWIDGYIDRVRGSFPREKRSGLVAYLAAFVGECIISTFGGKWSQDDDGTWGVSVTDRFRACPLAKIEKQFEYGREDSVARFVEAIPVLAKYLAEPPIGN